MADLTPGHVSGAEVFETVFFEEREFQGSLQKLPVVEYLKLLHLTGDDATSTVMKLRSILAHHPVEIVEKDIERALSQPNWRPHLMACVAIADRFRTENTVSAIWDGMRGLSWVLPQLVATAAYVDNRFIEKASEIVSRQAGNTRLVVTLSAVLLGRFSIDLGSDERLAPIVEAAQARDRQSLDPNPGRFALPWFDRLREILG